MVFPFLRCRKMLMLRGKINEHAILWLKGLWRFFQENLKSLGTNTLKVCVAFLSSKLTFIPKKKTECVCVYVLKQIFCVLLPSKKSICSDHTENILHSSHVLLCTWYSYSIFAGVAFFSQIFFYSL